MFRLSGVTRMSTARSFTSPAAFALAAAAFLAVAFPSLDDAEAKGKGCPEGMASIKGKYCIDKFEASTVEILPGGKTRPHSPFEAVEGLKVKAVSRRGVKPQAHISRNEAEAACKNAGKRLCTLDEWRTACRGEKDLPFPYGDKYEQGKCNIFREGHPAMELHNNASIGHSDPRLNQVKKNGKPLLRRTGETASCASVWEDDAIYDMVGNLDEWIDDPEGTFVGGFFSRSKKDGCASTITAHPYEYFDYSTGTRCCKELGEDDGER